MSSVYLDKPLVLEGSCWRFSPLLRNPLECLRCGCDELSHKPQYDCKMGEASSPLLKDYKSEKLTEKEIAEIISKDIKDYKDNMTSIKEKVEELRLVGNCTVCGSPMYGPEKCMSDVNLVIKKTCVCIPQQLAGWVQPLQSVQPFAQQYTIPIAFPNAPSWTSNGTTYTQGISFGGLITTTGTGNDGIIS